MATLTYDLEGRMGEGQTPGPAALAQEDHERAQLRALQDQIIRENLHRVFLVIYRLVGNVDDAQDLTQEAFIKALQRLDQLKDSAKAAQWISRIATNAAIDFLRRSGRKNMVELDSLYDTPPAPPSEDPEALLLRAEQHEQLEGGLRCLTWRERCALLLRDVEDLPAEEVARRMGCSKATVRSHVANARIKFRRYLEGRKS